MSLLLNGTRYRYLVPLFVLITTSAFAGELAPEGTRARKFQRGMLNTVLAPVELTHSLRQVEKKDTLIPSWLLVAPEGLVKVVARAVTGVYEMITAPLAWPREFQPLYQPELVTAHLETPPPDSSR